MRSRSSRSIACVLACLVGTAACGDDGASRTPDDADLPDDGPQGDAGPTCLDDDLCGDGIDNDCDGTPDDGCEAGIGTFVSAHIGDDSNPGTVAAPVRTIAKGIANAIQLGGPRTVILGEGVYEEKVTLVEGVDILGGHQCDADTCTFERDLSEYTTTIANTDFEGVLAGPTITRETLLSGLTILGLSGLPPTATGTVALTCAGGCPTLRGNRLSGGNAPGADNEANSRSVALSIGATADPTGVLVENNEIVSGTATSASIGVLVDNKLEPATTTLVHITGNVIRSSAARRSTAVVALRTSPASTLSGNDITSGGSMMGASYGVQVSSPLLVDANRINIDRALTGVCQQAQTWCAGIVVEGTMATLTNNVSLGPRGFRTAGLLLAQLERPAGKVLAVNNYISGGGTANSSIPVGARSQSAAVVVAVSAANVTFADSVGTLINNILDGGVNLDRFGVREDPAAMREVHVDSLIANAFQFSTQVARVDTYYRQILAAGVPVNFTSILTMEAAAPPTSSSNIDDDCNLDPTFHLPESSPCIDAGKDEDVPAKDFEGDDRPAGNGPDIGPDET